MASITIYHNPRCSKSRQTLELLEQQGADIEIVEYLKTPPSKSHIKSILAALKVTPREIMRNKEPEYLEAGLDNPDLTVDQQIEAMINFPKVIERPIVVKGKQAVIGRPPENVLALF